MEEGLLPFDGGRGRVVASAAAAAAVEHGADADREETADDEQDADPLVAEEPLLERDARQDPGEDDDGAPQHLEAGGVGEGEPDVLDGGGRHVAEGGRQEDEGAEGGGLGVGVAPPLPGLPPPPPNDHVVRHHAHHLPDEHAAGLHEGVVEAAPLAVRRLRGHGVGPLDGEGVDGARDEHEGGEAEVEPVHPRKEGCR